MSGRFDKNKPLLTNNGKKKIVYTGSLYAGKQNPEKLLQSLSLCLSDKQHVIINKLEVCFYGPFSEYLESLIDQYKLSDLVTQKGMLDNTESIQVQGEADILLFIDFDPKFKGITTGKIFEYINNTTTIWSISGEKNSTANNLIRKSNSGLIFVDDVVSLKNEIIKLVYNSNKKAFVRNTEFVQKFDREVLAKKMINLVSN